MGEIKEQKQEEATEQGGQVEPNVRRKNYIVEKYTFRSKPFVNMTDDMLRVIIYIERKWFFKLRKLIDNLNV